MPTVIKEAKIISSVAAGRVTAKGITAVYGGVEEGAARDFGARF